MYIIYKHTNTTNNKSYIGLTSTTLQERFNQHKSTAKLTKEKGNKPFHFHAALLKYDENVWNSEILDKAYTLVEANEKEKYYIAKCDSYNNGYNSTEGGDSFPASAHKGFPKSAETRKKISEAQKGEKSVHYGKPMLPQTKEALRKANTGRKWTEESRAKASASRKGFKPKQESIDKMRKKLTGRKQAEETQAKKAATLKANRKFNTFKPWALRTPDGEIVVQLEMTKLEYAEKYSLPVKWFYSKFNGNTIKANKYNLLEGYAFSNLYDIIPDTQGKNT